MTDPKKKKCKSETDNWRAERNTELNIYPSPKNSPNSPLLYPHPSCTPPLLTEPCVCRYIINHVWDLSNAIIHNATDILNILNMNSPFKSEIDSIPARDRVHNVEQDYRAGDLHRPHQESRDRVNTVNTVKKLHTSRAYYQKTDNWRISKTGLS